MFAGFNLTFAPMHWLGLQGMVRRTAYYPPEAGFDFWNLVSTVGAFIIAAGVLVFMFNWWRSKKHGQPSGIDPWDARTVEWMTPNPTPEYNFGVSPEVTSLDHFWHTKYDEDEEGRPVRRADAEETLEELVETGVDPPHPIHLPAPSYYPVLFASGIPLVGWGIIFHTSLVGKLLILVGALVIASAAFGWSMEPLEEPHDEHDDEHSGEAAGSGYSSYGS